MAQTQKREITFNEPLGGDFVNIDVSPKRVHYSPRGLFFGLCRPSEDMGALDDAVSGWNE